ncbi:ectonucleoside triphosphate diphosphohydrolase 1 isoform X2 [Arapaima gigas]
MAGQREMREKNPWHRRPIIIIAVLFTVVIGGLVTMSVMQNKPIHQKYKYGIVLDAGSSHTSVYVYQWPAEKENNTGMVTQKHTCNVKGKGISSYFRNANQAGPSLRECMEEAERAIPTPRHQETPVYLGATAGMRLLRKENETASGNVLLSVMQFLQATPFSFQGARIITGQEEGAYGWITVNYLSDNFRRAQHTMGALDLGGASTQITFESGDHFKSINDFIHFRLYGKEYRVYTHSFLCYGKDQALKLFLDRQLQAHPTGSGKQTLEDPCFHPGYNKSKSVQDIYNSPCVSEVQPSKAEFTHKGTGNWMLCQKNVRRIFNFSECTSSSCSFNGVFQPPLKGQFGAFSAFFFVMDFLNLTSEPLEVSKKKLAAYCSMPWDEVTKNHKKVKEKYLQEYCFSGTYILTLLEDGYNFTSETWKDIKFIKKIANSDAGWTLGYMLNLTNMIPAEAPDSPPIPHAGYVTLMVLFVFVLFFLIVLAYCFFRRSSSASQKQIV